MSKNFTANKVASFSCLALVLLGGCLFWFRPAQDPDLGWQLLGGQLVYESLVSGSFAVPRTDFINVFRAEWHDYHWFAQLLMYKLYLEGSWEALHGGLALVAVLSLFTVLALSRRIALGCDEVSVVLGLLWCWTQLFNISTVRPQMILLFFVPLSLLVLLSAKTFWWQLLLLFFLSVLGANIHVYWIFIPFLWSMVRCLPRLFGGDTRGPLQTWGGLFLLMSAGLFSPYGLLQKDLSGISPILNYAVVWDYMFTPDFLKKDYYGVSVSSKKLELLLNKFSTRYIGDRKVSSSELCKSQ